MHQTASAVFIALFSLFPFSVNADAERCATIENNFDRLSCYDQEFGFTPSSPEPAVTTGNWAVETETSKMDDSKNVFLALESKEHTNCAYKDAPHSIYIACRENETNIWVYFGDCFMSSTQGKGRITYRLDSEKSQNATFHESNNNMALGLWSGSSAIPFIKKMIGHDRMVVRATPFSDSTVTSEFEISGLEEAVKPLRAACKW